MSLKSFDLLASPAPVIRNLFYIIIQSVFFHLVLTALNFWFISNYMCVCQTMAINVIAVIVISWCFLIFTFEVITSKYQVKV